MRSALRSFFSAALLVAVPLVASGKTITRGKVTSDSKDWVKAVKACEGEWSRDQARACSQAALIARFSGDLATTYKFLEKNCFREDAHLCREWFQNVIADFGTAMRVPKPGDEDGDGILDAPPSGAPADQCPSIPGGDRSYYSGSGFSTKAGCPPEGAIEFFDVDELRHWSEKICRMTVKRGESGGWPSWAPQQEGEDYSPLDSETACVAAALANTVLSGGSDFDGKVPGTRRLFRDAPASARARAKELLAIACDRYSLGWSCGLLEDLGVKVDAKKLAERRREYDVFQSGISESRRISAKSAASAEAERAASAASSDPDGERRGQIANAILGGLQGAQSSFGGSASATPAPDAISQAWQNSNAQTPFPQPPPAAPAATVPPPSSSSSGGHAGAPMNATPTPIAATPTPTPIPTATPAATVASTPTPAPTATPAATPAPTPVYQPGGEFNYCITSFFDKDLYNWYSVRNNCSETLAITVCGNTSGGCWTMTISPGKKDSNGQTKDETNADGGFSVYPCRDGFIPVDANAHVVTHGNQQYHCLKQ